MSKTNNYIFTGLKIVSWVIFIGLCVQAGSYITNFTFSIYKPELIQNLYPKLDLIDVYNQNKEAFYSLFTFIMVVSTLKAILFYEVVKLVSSINLLKPFNQFVSRQISTISFYALIIGVMSFIGGHTTNNMQFRGFNTHKLTDFWSGSQAFILMSAVIYIIAIIFKKGVEYQDELDQTV
ncbi:MAG: DUF2975 domain-containing protein [Flavobacteriaceae bacterium]